MALWLHAGILESKLTLKKYQFYKKNLLENATMPEKFQLLQLKCLNQWSQTHVQLVQKFRMSQTPFLTAQLQLCSLVKQQAELTLKTLSKLCNAYQMKQKFMQCQIQNPLKRKTPQKVLDMPLMHFQKQKMSKRLLLSQSQVKLLKT